MPRISLAGSGQVIKINQFGDVLMYTLDRIQPVSADRSRVPTRIPAIAIVRRKQSQYFFFSTNP